MKFYKFRDLRDPRYTLDILKEERLYCALHDSLNDPFEGLFSTIEWVSGLSRPVTRPVTRSLTRPITRSHQATSYKTVNDLPSLQSPTRVCSLCSNFSDIRMWSHYAVSHTGCAIEVDLAVEPPLFEVKYLNELKKFSTGIDSDTKASDILVYKTSHWAYEQEYRIITENEFFSIKGKITAVYLGIRVGAEEKSLIQKHVPSGVPVLDCKLDKKSISIQPR